MNFCTNCGQPLAETAAQFCTHCGAPTLNADGSPGSPVTSHKASIQAGSPVADSESSIAPTSRRMPLLVGSFVILALMVGAAGVFTARATSEGGNTTTTPTATSEQKAPAAPIPVNDATHTLYFRPEGEDAAEFVGVKVTGSQAEGYVAFPDTLYCFRGTVSDAGLDGTALVSGEVKSTLEPISWPARGSGGGFELLSGPEQGRLIPTTENGLPPFFTSLDPKKRFSECAKSWAAGPRKYV